MVSCCFSGALAVPEGGEERQSAFPKLECREFTVRGKKREGAADLVCHLVFLFISDNFEEAFTLPSGSGVSSGIPDIPIASLSSLPSGSLVHWLGSAHWL